MNDVELLMLLRAYGVLDSLTSLALQARTSMEARENLREYVLSFPVADRDDPETREYMEGLDACIREDGRIWRTWLRSPLATVPIELQADHDGVRLHFEVGQG